MPASETVGQRFTQLINHLGISKNAFALSLDKTATVIQHLVEERNKPGFDLLCRVFEAYPNVSKDWLMQGVGPMLLDGSPAAAATAAPPATAPETPPAVPSAETSTPAGPAKPIVAGQPEASSAPVAPLAAAVPASQPAADAAAWQTALYTQQMAHQLAIAELRNQHLQEQQRLMQQMLDLMQRRP